MGDLCSRQVVFVKWGMGGRVWGRAWLGVQWTWRDLETGHGCPGALRSLPGGTMVVGLGAPVAVSHWGLCGAAHGAVAPSG